MNGIYETRGRAREYCELAVNLYRGCGHACTYCSAPLTTHQDRIQFQRNPCPRLGILDQLEHDATVLERRGSRGPVLLCFICDPYQPIDCQWELTRGAIKILHAHCIRVNILTKGGKRAMRDFDILDPGTKGDQFAVTLTVLQDDKARELEPGAAPPSGRVISLVAARNKGIQTWVSLEPIVSLEAAQEIIEATHPVVGHYKCGTMNYQNLGLNWTEVALRLKAYLDSKGIRYYFKASLAEHLNCREGFWGGHA